MNRALLVRDLIVAFGLIAAGGLLLLILERINS